MSKVNRPDTLFRELRELRRRIRLLESATGRGATGPGSSGGTPAPVAPAGDDDLSGDDNPAGSPLPQPMLPARPVDWWSVSSREWESVAELWLPASDQGWWVEVTVANGGGEVRLVLDGRQLSAPMSVHASERPESFRFTSPVQGGGKLEVEASGTFRMIAAVRTS